MPYVWNKGDDSLEVDFKDLWEMLTPRARQSVLLRDIRDEFAKAILRAVQNSFRNESLVGVHGRRIEFWRLLDQNTVRARFRAIQGKRKYGRGLPPASGVSAASPILQFTRILRRTATDPSSIYKGRYRVVYKIMDRVGVIHQSIGARKFVDANTENYDKIAERILNRAFR